MVFLGTLLFAAASVITVLGMRNSIGYADVAVVLGNTVFPSGEPSPRLRGRLDKCVELFGQGMMKQIIVSGGLGREGHVEGVVMREYLLSRGIPDSVIVVDGVAHNTFETARFVSEYCQKSKLSSVTVVTQFYHVPRSRYALKRFGVKHVFNAHADYYEWMDVLSLFREVAGFCKYLFRKYPQ